MKKNDETQTIYVLFGDDGETFGFYSNLEEGKKDLKALEDFHRFDDDMKFHIQPHPLWKHSFYKHELKGEVPPRRIRRWKRR